MAPPSSSGRNVVPHISRRSVPSSPSLPLWPFPYSSTGRSSICCGAVRSLGCAWQRFAACPNFPVDMLIIGVGLCTKGKDAPPWPTIPSFRHLLTLPRRSHQRPTAADNGNGHGKPKALVQAPVADDLDFHRAHSGRAGRHGVCRGRPRSLTLTSSPSAPSS